MLNERLTDLINDYVSTINECDRLNSLKTKLEDFIEIIGIMCTISVGNVAGLQNLENTATCMKEIINKF